MGCTGFDLTGAGKNLTIWKVTSAFKLVDFSAAIDFIGNSNIHIEGLGFTNNHTSINNDGTTYLQAFIKLKSSPNKCHDIEITKCSFSEYSAVQAIDGANAASTDSTHWLDNVHIGYNDFLNGYQPGRQIITVDPVNGQQCRGINIEQTMLSCEIDHNNFIKLSGEAILGAGTNAGLQRNPKQGGINTHDNYGYQCLMFYEVASGYLNHNVKEHDNQWFYPTLNGGFAISGNSDGGEYYHDVIKVANRTAMEGVFRNTSIHDMTVYMDAWRDTTQGIKNTLVTNGTASFLQYYGDGNSIYNNKVYKDRTGADAMTPSYFNDITIVGKASGGDTAIVNTSYMGYSDYPAFLQVYHNTFCGTGLTGKYNHVIDPGDTAFLPIRNLSFWGNTIITDATSTPLYLKAFNPNIGENYWYMKNAPATGQGLIDFDSVFISKGKRASGFVEKQKIFAPASWLNKRTEQFTPYPGTGTQPIAN